MEDFLQKIVLGNTLQSYLIALGSMLIAWLILKIVRGYIIKALKKITSQTTTEYDDIVVSVAEQFILPYIYLLINYGILKQLELSAKVDKVFNVAISMITTYYGVRLVNHVIHKSVEMYMKHKNEPPERLKQLNGIVIVIKVLVWLIGLLLLAENLGYDITTIIAGLGVGGIAIALAAQNILSDLFSYFVIFFDKPFEIGDFILVGTNSGTVERIGIKTSHIRSVTGEQLIMPNAEMVKTTIKNFKRLEKRGIVFSIGVLYETPEEKLKEIPGIIKTIIESMDGVTFARSHLKSFGDFSINFETFYFVESSDYLVYMNKQQEINLAIFKAFQEKGIGFAYPTQTLYLSKMNG